MWLPKVATRLEKEWIKPGYYISQLSSGHGESADKLRGFGLRQQGRCEYGEGLDTAEHTMFKCKPWIEERTCLGSVIGKCDDRDWVGYRGLAKAADRRRFQRAISVC